MVRAVDAHLLEAQRAAQALSTSHFLVTRNFAAFQSQASALLRQADIGTNIILSDVSGQQLVNTLLAFGEPLPRRGNLEQVRSVFASGQPLISDVYLSAVTHRPVVSIDVPVLIDGRVAYVLTVGILSQRLSQVLHDQHLPSDWLAGITDSTGTIAARTHIPEQFMGKKASMELVQRMLEAAPEGTLETTSLEGIPSLMAYSRSPLSHWCAAIAIPRHTLEAKLTHDIFFLAFSIAILFGVAVGLAWFVGGQISRSVRALIAPAIALAAGEKSIPVTAKVYFREAGEVAKAMARTAQILTQRTQALHKLHEMLGESEQRYRTLVEWSPEAIIIFQDEKILYVNPAAIALFGAGSAQSLTDKPAFDLIHPDFHLVVLARAKHLTKHGGVLPMIEVQAIRLDGTVMEMEVQSASIIYDGKLAVHGSMRDITERKRAEQALLHSKTKLRKLAHHQEIIKEKERKRIARDIHDDLGQHLMVLRINLSLMAAQADTVAITSKGIDEVLHQIDITIKSVRTIINDLRPAALDFGLHAAIEWQAREFQRRNDIACTLQINHDEFALDDERATALFRIVQEALTNILRHAQASQVHIALKRRDGQLCVTVTDDGIGLAFDGAKKENSFGLIGIEERIDALGGTFCTGNNPDRGMAIGVSIPIDVAATHENR